MIFSDNRFTLVRIMLERRTSVGVTPREFARDALRGCNIPIEFTARRLPNRHVNRVDFNFSKSRL